MLVVAPGVEPQPKIPKARVLPMCHGDNLVILPQYQQRSKYKIISFYLARRPVTGVVTGMASVADLLPLPPLAVVNVPFALMKPTMRSSVISEAGMKIAR